MTARGRLGIGTAILAGVVAAIVAAARLGVDRPDERALSARASEDRVVAVEPGRVSAVELDRGGDPVVLRREEVGWVVSRRAGDAPADPRDVEGFLARLAGLRTRAAVAPGKDPAVYGLASPRLRIRLLVPDAPAGAQGRVVTLDVGNDTPVGGSFYARRGDEVLAIEGPAAPLLSAAAGLAGRRD